MLTRSRIVGAVGLLAMGLVLWWRTPIVEDPASRRAKTPGTSVQRPDGQASPGRPAEHAGGRFAPPGVELTLAETTMLEVAVVDGSLNEPIEGAAVSFARPEKDLAEGPDARLAPFDDAVVTDAGGIARLKLRRGEPYRILASAEGFVPAIRRVVAAESQRFSSLRLTLAPRTGLRGRVVDQNGLPVAGASVRMAPLAGAEPVPVEYSRSGRGGRATAVDGGFEFLSLAPGRYQVIAAGPSHLGASVAVELERQGIEDLTIGIVHRDELVTLTGRVIDSAARPVWPVRLRLMAADGRFLQQGRVTRDGAFRIDTAPRRAVRLEVEWPGYQPWAQEFELTSDVDKKIQLVELPRLVVTVVDPLGQPVDDAVVLGDGWISENGLPVRRRVLSRDGRSHSFHTSHYPVRIYAHAQHRGLGVSEVVTIGRYQPRVELQLGSVGRLRGRCVDAEGRALERFSVQVIAIDGRDGLDITGRQVFSPDGAFTLEGVPVGRLTLRFEAAGAGSAQTEVSVTDQQAPFVEVALRPGS